MVAEKRGYITRNVPTTEAAILTLWFSHLYISPGDMRQDRTALEPGQFNQNSVITTRIFWKPLVTLIWIGALVMVVGGMLSLSDRRLRVGAPKKSRTALAPAE